MAYRRRQGITRASTFKEEIHHSSDHDHDHDQDQAISSSSSPNSYLAAKAVRASTAHRDSSSLSSAYGNYSFDSSSAHRSKGHSTYEYTSFKSKDEPPKGFWGVLALKAKSILEDDAIAHKSTATSTLRPQPLEIYSDSQFNRMQGSSDSNRRLENPRLRKGLDALASSLNHIGDTIGNALEEGRTIVENKTADIKLQIRRKGSNSEEQNDSNSSSIQQGSTQNHHETQLKASRDVAMATAAKAKLLLRELKTIKADLAFARERCTQLEEENKMLRESREKGVNPADDDMIRLQLETLLNEKSRLATENSIYARENRFLREIVEYHQLTMQDVVYLDEGIEQVTEVYPIPAVARMLSISPPNSDPSSPPSLYGVVPPRISNSSVDFEREQTHASTAVQPPKPSTVTGGGRLDLTPQDTTSSPCSREEELEEEEDSLSRSNGSP